MKRILGFLSRWFNKLPKEIKVIYYIVSSSILMLLIRDISEIQSNSEYLVVIQTGLINLLQFSLIQLGDKYNLIKEVENNPS